MLLGALGWLLGALGWLLGALGWLLGAICNMLRSTLPPYSTMPYTRKSPSFKDTLISHRKRHKQQQIYFDKGRPDLGSKI